MLRVAEISNSSSSSSSSSDAEDEPISHGRRVSFTAASGARPVMNGNTASRKRSPPPPVETPEDDEDEGYEDDEGEELGLQRFPSAAAQPPKMIPDEGDEAEVDEPKSPSEEELRSITAGKGKEDWVYLYNRMRECHCHGNCDTAPVVENMWELPGKEGGGGRMAVVQVAPGTA